MAAFLSALILNDDGTGDSFTLVRPLRYQTDVPPTRVITVPIGFTTDFASVPRGFWNLFPKTGPWDRASVVHDYLYRTQGSTKAGADAIFYEAMGVSGVPAWKRVTLYLAVTIGGRSAWKASRKRTDL